MSTLALAWALVVAGASFTALFRALGRRRTPPAALRGTRRIVLVRPCAGHEGGLAERLAASGGADAVAFAIESSLDPAATSAHRAARALSARGTEAFVVQTRAQGPNHKAEQLAKAVDELALTDDDVVIVADSDVDLERTDLYALASCLDEPRVGAAWAPPIEAGEVVTFGDRVARAVLSSSLHAFPLLAGIDRTGMVGKLFAVRVRALRAAGGFAPLVDRLGEDVALARALRAAGWTVRAAPVYAPSVASGRTARAVVARLARWVQVVRSERPWLLPSYPLLFAPAAFALAALYAGVVRSDRTLAAAGVLVVVSRLAVARGSVGDALVGDGALLAAFVRALWSRTFAWRGRRLRIGSGGRLESEGTRDEGEDTLREASDERRRARVDDLEVAEVGGVDPRELGGDGVALLTDVHASQRRADRDPQVGGLRAGKDVADRERHDVRGLGPTGDVRGARSELQGRKGRALAAFGEDPHRPARPVEQSRGMTNGSRAVARIVEVDPERTDETEEREALEVSGVHHRIRLDGEEIGDEERDERIPPGRVVRDDEERSVRRGDHGALSAVHEDATERGADTAPRMAREPAGEQRGAPRRDHRRRP